MRLHRWTGTLKRPIGWSMARPGVWRDNQDENAATIKMRMPRRLALALMEGKLAASDGGRA